jgi:hypothetical protein
MVETEFNYCPKNRENMGLVNAEDCKDSEGKWTKWVLERCDEN